jgi:hypothetical protein
MPEYSCAATVATATPVDPCLLKRRGIAHPIPERSVQSMRHSQRPGPPFDQKLYSRRNVVEQCINRLNRYEKKAVHFHTVFVIACFMIWMNS